MTVSTRIIVLNLTKTGERSVVLHCLTPDYGRRSFIVSVGKSCPASLFLPLNVLDAEVIENPKSDLWRLKSVSACHALNDIRNSYSKNAMTLFMSEVLYRTVKDGSREEGLFEWCEKSILMLDALQSDYANYHLRFLMELCGALGFSPSMSDLAPFAEANLKDLEALLSADLEHFLLYPLSGSSRNTIAKILLKYLGYHTESSINVKSLDVLPELFV